MKYIPSRKQWKNWTLPSKASYLGVIMALFLFVTGLIITQYFDAFLRHCLRNASIVKNLKAKKLMTCVCKLEKSLVKSKN